ncbi:NAD-dependent epimerase/dehydratase family protein [Paracoccus aestuarii]|uniref:NAD-dependent epimerase/dehydratase family protein n=1 Tax=Paracoccus aestuarii TaxID=453842 RepID=A0A418ZV82_9RHOB|nr:AMP-binding protein [Paracoccus aestuarii]RJL02833.1 NAD-dependent epimerase/dehydratase family protein [Paracoccus aestuarii]WCR01183.1 AMP-binding protein [Paracoccus aestuarii]
MSDPIQGSLPAELVQAMARHADRPAMRDRARHLSYGQLARAVAAMGAGLGDAAAVGIYGVPGVPLGAAVVAATVAGRPFVHLDPAMPDQVLGNILDELRIDTVIACQPVPQGRLPAACRVIEAAPCLTADAAPAQAATVDPGDPVYLVATSGTTGRPKCIPVTHDAAWLSYRWRDAHTPYGPGMRVGIYIFAIWELLRPLRDGAELVFPGLNDLMSPQALVAFLRDARIDEMLFTPSFLEKTLTAIAPDGGTPLPLRRVILNGEVVTPALAAEARRKLPGAEILNLYSICETHDISLTRLEDGCDGSVGVAMPHLRAVVLDDDDRPCPPGQPGRLHFEGPRMLGPGYVNRPEETAQRFRDLVIEGRAARLYDTGDQGFVAPDGRIHVLGRIAHMLKLRGHSIQTADLVQTLSGALRFRQAIPWVQQIPGQGQALILYYTADAEGADHNARHWGLGDGWRRMPADLARRLQAQLPRYCIPAWLVRLDEVPLHPVSGKCDHRALPPAPPADRIATGDAGPPVLTHAAAILGLAAADLDPDRSFQDQGGDSLSCVDFLIALEAAHGRPVDFEWALTLPLMRLHALLTQDEAARPDRPDRPGILLTGATGFLGGHVLARLAASLPPDQVIYCLVRPRNRDAQDRLMRAARDHGVDPARLRAVPGTLDQPMLGLDGDSHAGLARAVSRVIHCAAMVNLAVDRDHMEGRARTAIGHVLDFCRAAGAGLVFSSSTSAFPDQGGSFPEGPVRPFDGISGYGAAKIAAEAAIAASGVDALILRLPSLYDLDRPNPRDIYETVMAACARMGRAPRDLRFHMTDVRAAAQVMADHRPRGLVWANLVADRPVTVPGDMAPADWLDQAPLEPAMARFLRDAPDSLTADPACDNARARDLWPGDFDRISQARTLLARRLPAMASAPRHQGDPAFTG